MRRDVINSALAVLILTLVFGVAYPLATTGIAQVIFSGKADGSRVERNGHLVGSKLIAQDFKKPVLDRQGKPRTDADGNPVLEPDPRYFQSRPSATSYNPSGTFFNNLGPNNKELSRLFRDNRAAYISLERPYNGGLRASDVPVDAVTTSASGVDPHISEANARIQSRRVAAVRKLPLARVQQLVGDQTDDRDLGVLGEPGVNVLELNLALDREGT